MTGLKHAFLVLAAATALWAADALYESAWNKLERIEMGRAAAGSVTTFTAGEINAFARGSIPQTVDGLRNPQIQLGEGTATASAMVDLLKMRGADHGPVNPVVAMLLEGEKPLKVSVRVASSNGTATVYLTSLEISGVSASGRMLDLLMKQVFLPLFPDARVNQPFELQDDIDHIDVHPDGVRVMMRR